MNQIKTEKDWRREDVVKLLSKPTGNRGIELGVAEGIFSERMVKSGCFNEFFGVDMYADSHDTAQYKRALERVGLSAQYKLLRMTFNEAFDLFPDEYFDFVYVDGYAHSGEEGGETIYEWFKKVKVGGVIAGDDYDERWPLVVQAVDSLAEDLGADIVLTGVLEEDTIFSECPSWAISKTSSDCPSAAPAAMVAKGKLENKRVLARRKKAEAIRTLVAPVKQFVPRKVRDFIHRRI